MQFTLQVDGVGHTEDYNEPCRVLSPLWISAPSTVGHHLLLRSKRVPPLSFHSRSHLRTKSIHLHHLKSNSITRNSAYWCKRIFLGQQQWMERKCTSQFNCDKLLVWFCHNAKLSFTTTDSYGQHAMQKAIWHFYCLQKQNLKKSKGQNKPN